MLHANTVVAAIRLLSLWRGRLEVSRISVDEASLNLVRRQRRAAGTWIHFFVPQPRATPMLRKEWRPPLPYLEATNSRINIKKGIEKLPFSLVNADIAFWQENAGDWRAAAAGPTRAHGCKSRSCGHGDRATRGQDAPCCRSKPDADSSRARLAGSATWPAEPADRWLRPRLARRSDRRNAIGRHGRNSAGEDPPYARLASIVQSSHPPRRSISMPIAALSITMSAVPSRSFLAIRPWATGTSRLQAISREMLHRSSQWKFSVSR